MVTITGMAPSYRHHRVPVLSRYSGRRIESAHGTIPQPPKAGSKRWAPFGPRLAYLLFWSQSIFEPEKLLIFFKHGSLTGEAQRR